MKNFIFLFLLFAASNIYAQNYDDDLITLAEIIDNEIHNNSKADQEVIDKLNRVKSKKLQFVKDFLVLSFSNPNELISQRFLEKPKEVDLYHFNFTFRLYQKFYRLEKLKGEERQLKYQEVFDEIKNEERTNKQFLYIYYDMLFSSFQGKNQKMSLAQNEVNFRKLKLKTSEEKNIFFMTCLNTYRFEILCEMNGFSNGSDYSKARSYFNQYPLFEGKKFYFFNTLAKEDFNVIIALNKEYDSFKKEFFTEYLRLLVYYYQSYNNDEEERINLIKNSIILDEKYWKFVIPQVVQDLEKVKADIK
ncbi:hypothetical protein [Flammeovirga sp. EKP202]|uniref:hypothetical protein n=1 Tax=Flammeovirga sp. EKP202 TaxID=2770592 RepID=UPI00165FFE27|nr:hypothetical protein [Flammeovirga sp. EKP202]MBD0404970.1 hypothetical protein [Flammeovirga sp. EKP202]